MSYTSLGGIQAIAGVFIGLTIVVVTLRLYARATVKVGLQSDDWCMLSALVAFLVFCSCVLVLGQIEWIGGATVQYPPDVAHARALKGIKVTLCVVFFLNIALALTKISALLLYRRIFCVRTQWRTGFESAIFVTILFTICWLISYTVLAFWQYRHNIQNLPKISTGQNALTIGWQDVVALCVIDLVLDIWVVSLPIPTLLSLHMTRTNKALVVGVFAIAFIGVAASIARLVNIILLDYKLSAYANSEHPLTRVYFFHILELGTTIVAINAPIMWGLIQRICMEDFIKLSHVVVHLSSRASEKSKDRSEDLLERRNDSVSMAIELGGIEGKNEAYATKAASDASEFSIPSSMIVVHESVTVSREQKQPGE